MGTLWSRNNALDMTANKQLPYQAHQVQDRRLSVAIATCGHYNFCSIVATVVFLSQHRLVVSAGGRHIVSIYKQCSIYGDWCDGYNLSANNPNVAMACIGIDVDRGGFIALPTECLHSAWVIGASEAASRNRCRRFLHSRHGPVLFVNRIMESCLEWAIANAILFQCRFYGLRVNRSSINCNQHWLRYCSHGYRRIQCFPRREQRQVVSHQDLYLIWHFCWQTL